MPAVKELQVNGKAHAVDADAARTLLSVLRDDLGLTGAKYGCGEGHCGACTVIVDGRQTRSCSTLVGAAAKKPISTIESLSTGEKLHALQEAFLETGAMQCGYCTTGMIMTAYVLLTNNPEPTRDEIVRWMTGNICRCGTYTRIIAAVERAAAAMKGGAK